MVEDLKVWGLIKDGEKIIKSLVIEENSINECLLKICYEFDIEKPVWLKKHDNEINDFGRVVFKPVDFIENVMFSSFELEVLKRKEDRN